MMCCKMKKMFVFMCMCRIGGTSSAISSRRFCLELGKQCLEAILFQCEYKDERKADSKQCYNEKPGEETANSTFSFGIMHILPKDITWLRS